MDADGPRRALTHRLLGNPMDSNMHTSLRAFELPARATSLHSMHTQTSCQLLEFVF